MIWVLIIIFVLLIFLGVWFSCEFDFIIFGSITMVIGGIAEICLAILLFWLIYTYPFEVDKKINMYEEENIKIEEKVKNTVRVYMDYEKETYTNLIEDSDLTTLLIAYPELNSNELVKSEVQLYIENNAKIKELKEHKIDRRTYRFMLYFGK